MRKSNPFARGFATTNRHITFAIIRENWRLRPTLVHPGTCDRKLRAVRGSSRYMPHQGGREKARRRRQYFGAPLREAAE